MKRILTLLVLASVFCGATKLQAQIIPQFSQYMFNGLYINPAYAGYKEELYAHILFRRQWIGVEGAPQTVMMGVDADMTRGSNVGIVFANDKIGITQTNNLMLNYAYRFPVSELGRLSFGLAAGAIHYGLDKSKLKPGDQLLQYAESIWRPQVDAGAYFDLPNFYAGFSVKNIITGSLDDGVIQIMRTDPVYFLTFGGMIRFDDYWALAPSTLLKTEFKSPLSVDVTLMGVYAETVWLGLSYRTGLNFTFTPEKGSETLRQNDALVIVAEAYLWSNFRVGMAYDFDLTHLSNNFNGGIEVSLGYYLNWPRKIYATPRYF